MSTDKTKNKKDAVALVILLLLMGGLLVCFARKKQTTKAAVPVNNNTDTTNSLPVTAQPTEPYNSTDNIAPNTPKSLQLLSLFQQNGYTKMTVLRDTVVYEADTSSNNGEYEDQYQETNNSVTWPAGQTFDLVHDYDIYAVDYTTGNLILYSVAQGAYSYTIVDPNDITLS